MDKIRNQRLKELMAIIDDNIKSFYKIGSALREIRDKDRHPS